MSRRLNDLSDRMRPLAVELLARLVEAGIAVMVVDTLRTPAEHAINLANGTSRIKHSKHLDGDAIDVCPYAQFNLHGPDKLQWDTGDPVWTQIGAIGESLGLRWGGRYRPLNAIGVGWDPGHFEYPTSAPPTDERHA